MNLKSNYSSITDKIFKNKRLGPYFIDYIKKNLIDCEGYIRLSVIETLDLLKAIDNDIKSMIQTRPHKLKMTYSSAGFSINFPVDLMHILNVLLKIFTFEEAIRHLEQFHLKSLQELKFKKHENKTIKRIIFDEILDKHSFISDKNKFLRSMEGRFIHTYGDHFVDTLIEDFFIAFNIYKRYYELFRMALVLSLSTFMGQKAINAIIIIIVPRNLENQIPLIKNYIKRVGLDNRSTTTHEIDQLKPNTIIKVQGEVISIIDTENDFIITLRLINMETLRVKSKVLCYSIPIISIGDMIMIRGELINDKKWGQVLIPVWEGNQQWDNERYLSIEKYEIKEKKGKGIKKDNVKFKTVMKERKESQEKVELQKESELLKQLSEIEKLIEEKKFQTVEDKLGDIIQEAKRYHLNILENKAKEKYKKYKSHLDS
ncbi:MAG: hypothetical protein ACTSR5_09120 [Promethearchaeota archaeon]